MKKTLAPPRAFATRAVHGSRMPASGPLATPIVQSATFVFESSAQMRDYLHGDPALHLYTRYSNPTLAALEESLAQLEGGEGAIVFSSGLAAMTTALWSTLSAGDEVLASSSLYGGTTKFIRKILPRFGVAHRIVPVAEMSRLESYLSPNSKVVVLESPTNPNVDIVDIAAVARAAHARGALVIVDNTFATPFNQRPLELGADLVMHSLTKALSGHSDIIAGALIGSAAHLEPAREHLKVLGGCMDPHAAYLALRGLKTVHLRAARQAENAMAVVQALAGHPKLSRVLYPGLPSHPGHAIAKRQMATFGSMFALSLRGGLAAAEKCYDALELVGRAASLGGVESIVSLPVHTSHHGYSDEELAQAGVDAGMMRFSMGVEDARDIAADIEQALDAS